MDPLRILCANCHEFLYFFKGEFTGEFQMLDFVPAKPDTPRPKPNTPMLCHKCGQAWYVVRKNGAIYLFTDKGWKPRAPDGEAPMTMRKGIRALLPEMPPDMLDDRGNYHERG